MRQLLYFLAAAIPAAVAFLADMPENPSNRQWILFALSAIGPGVVTLKALYDRKVTDKTSGRAAVWLLVIPLSLSLAGCARFGTVQTERRFDAEGNLATEIQTRAASYTLFQSESELSRWEASQTSDEQAASVGGLVQSTDSGSFVTNAASGAAAIAAAVAAAIVATSDP